AAQSGQVSSPARPEPEPQPAQQLTPPAQAQLPPPAPTPPIQQPAPPMQGANTVDQHQNGDTAPPPPRQAAAGYASPMGNASVPPAASPRPRTPGTGGGSLPSRAVPVTDEPDDEVDVPPFMRR
ncbi:MAG TPA: cell division protein FtsZ, partial [Actinophytocola sp.]|nr:cell division protein FtsZ [Actinophytocola sp.]